MPTLADIALILETPAPVGAESLNISGIATLSDAGPSDLSLVGADSFVPLLLQSRAAATIVQRKVKLPADWKRPVLLVDDADIAIARIVRLFAPPIPQPPTGIDSSARVAASALISPEAAIGPNVIVGQRTRIGARCVVHANVYIGDDVVIGDDCQFFSGVVVRERITIGNRVIINACSVLGTDGFGYRWDGKQHVKIPQIGTVIIEDDVEIGSCVCVDRAKFSSTRIGRGTKIDNLVQVGHNAQVGPHCILVGQSGLAGSVRLGMGVLIGGQTAIRDHISMGDGAMAAACSGVAEDVPPKTIVSGLPALPHRQTLREQAAIRRLPDLVVLVRKLQAEIEAMKKTQAS